MIEFENRVEYRSRANWRWCTESVRRCAVTFTPCVYRGNSRASLLWNFSLFFLFFFFSFFFFSTFHPRRHCFHGYLSSPPSSSRRMRVRRSGRRETRHWASDFAADFTRKSFFDFGPATHAHTNDDDPLRFVAGEGNLITRLKFRIPRHPMIQAEGENIRREETQLKAYTIAYTIHRWGVVVVQERPLDKA